MELLYRCCENSQPETGRLVWELDCAAVSQAGERDYKKLVKDDQLGERVEEMHNPLVKWCRGKS